VVTGPAPEPVGRIVERNVGAGFRLFELAEDDDAALRDDWGDDDARVRIQPGRVGIESAASNHYPEITVSAYLAEPPPSQGSRRVPQETLGTWPVTFSTGFVQVWSTDSYPGDQLPLELPRALGGRYQMRVATGTKNAGDQTLEDLVDAYNEEHNEAPRGLELFTVDIWPANPSRR
jgi:hypothetical protein